MVVSPFDPCGCVVGDGICQAGDFSGLHWILYRIVFEVQLTGALLTTFIVNVQLCFVLLSVLRHWAVSLCMHGGLLLYSFRVPLHLSPRPRSPAPRTVVTRSPPLGGLLWIVIARLSLSLR